MSMVGESRDAVNELRAAAVDTRPAPRDDAGSLSDWTLPPSPVRVIGAVMWLGWVGCADWAVLRAL